MSVKNGKDYLYLIWKCETTRRHYIIGELTKNGQYEFQYCGEIEVAREAGFRPLVSFDELDKVYTCDELFPVFACRLPDSKRKDIRSILEKYGMQEYDAYQLLKRSGAKLPIDNLQFIDPILEFEHAFKKTFYLAGVRYYLECKEGSCGDMHSVTRGDELFLEHDEDNKHDENAVRVINVQGKLVGYIPRYYSHAFVRFLKEKRIESCHVVSVNKGNCCDECINVDVKILGVS